eukprot:s590_g36.t1
MMLLRAPCAGCDADPSSLLSAQARWGRRPEFEHYTFEDGQTSTESVGLTYREHVEYSAASPQQACAAKAKCDKSASSVAAFAAWCVTPDETDPEAMPPDRLSRSSSDSSVPSPGSRQSVSSDSIAVLGEALLRAREENSQSASSSQGIERVQSMFSPMGIA